MKVIFALSLLIASAAGQTLGCGPDFTAGKD